MPGYEMFLSSYRSGHHLEIHHFARKRSGEIPGYGMFSSSYRSGHLLEIHHSAREPQIAAPGNKPSTITQFTRKLRFGCVAYAGQRPLGTFSPVIPAFVASCFFGQKLKKRCNRWLLIM